jgi:hypothetical protein
VTRLALLLSRGGRSCRACVAPELQLNGIRDSTRDNIRPRQEAAGGVHGNTRAASSWRASHIQGSYGQTFVRAAIRLWETTAQIHRRDTTLWSRRTTAIGFHCASALGSLPQPTLNVPSGCSLRSSR